MEVQTIRTGYICILPQQQALSAALANAADFCFIRVPFK
jgi:hypothetical protein